MTKQQEQEVIMGASTEKLDRMCQASIDAGAYGAKLIGAGGGGCIIAICPEKEEEVQNALKKVGANSWKLEIYQNN